MKIAQGIKAKIEKEQLEQLLQQYTIKEIAKKLEVSESTIKRYKQKFNLSINPEIGRKVNSEKHTLYSCNNTYFDNIDTMNKAYLLGFICADGFLTTFNEVGIGVSQADEDVVKFFQKELLSNKPLHYKEDSQGHKSVELRIQNYNLANALKSYSIIPNKSLVLNIETVIQTANLNEEQISVFLLGYFDGDGCISIGTNAKTGQKYFEMNITGTKETLNYFYRYFDNKGTFTKRHADDKNNYTLQMSNNYSTIYNALSKLYKYVDKLDFYYNRKYQKFKQLESKIYK